MTLFENGKTDYTIVYPDERTEAEEYAASTLKEFFKDKVLLTILLVLGIITIEIFLIPYPFGENIK